MNALLIWPSRTTPVLTSTHAKLEMKIHQILKDQWMHLTVKWITIVTKKI